MAEESLFVAMSTRMWLCVSGDDWIQISNCWLFCSVLLLLLLLSRLMHWTACHTGWLKALRYVHSAWSLTLSSFNDVLFLSSWSILLLFLNNNYKMSCNYWWLWPWWLDDEWM